ncbi:MAG: hypothetical protein AAGA48_11270 [Myxococcota bacterium]
MMLEVPVHAARVPPDGLVLGSQVAAELGEGGVGIGDMVETPRGPRTIVEVRAGGTIAWAADGDSSSWTLSVGAKAAQRLRVQFSAAVVPDGEGYDPIHHTPRGGAPLTAGALDWLRARGAVAVLEDMAWRQDHQELGLLAHGTRRTGKRVGPAWRALPGLDEGGYGPIRDGLKAMCFVLGVGLTVSSEGVKIGLSKRAPLVTWSGGALTTAAAFRKGQPAPGGLHDPALVGGRNRPRFGHIELPVPLIPGHLRSVVADQLQRPVGDLMHLLSVQPATEIEVELASVLEERPLPSIDGRPMSARDFIWTEVPVVPATFRRPVRRPEGERVPHGIDGTLHALMAAVRAYEKRPDADPVELLVQLQTALDGYLVDGPGEQEGAWGWSVARDLQGTLQLDGILVDWAGHAVAVVEPGRRKVGVPMGFRSLFLHPDDPEAVLLVRMPEGVAAVRPELVAGPLVRLPLDIAGALGARTGELLRMVVAVSAEAQQELEALSRGARLSPMVPRKGFFDEFAASDDIGPSMVEAAKEQAVDRCLGPVGSRIWAGFVPTARGQDDEEREQIQRAIAAIDRGTGPGNTLPPGGIGDRLSRAEDRLGQRVTLELRNLWTLSDHQLAQAPPLWIDGEPWHLVGLDPDAVVKGRIVLATSDTGEHLMVDADGSVWRREELIGRSLGRLLQRQFSGGSPGTRR